MTQTLDLNKMGLAEISNFEMQETEGGVVPSWVKGFGITWFVGEIISNWAEIKQGAANGWNSVHYD